MFESFFRFVLSQRLLILIATVALCASGFFAWKNLPIDAFPDVTNVQVMILSEAPGLAPVDVEQRVTYPLELAMQGLPGVTQVRSLSKSALSQISIVFDDGTDIYFARQLVFERIASVKDSLPEGVEVELAPISTGLGEIYQYTLESDKYSAMELRTFQNWLIAPLLRTVSGVTEVNSFGGFVKQYQILVNPDNLLKYDLALRDITEAVEKNNANAGGDYIVKGWEQAYVRSEGMIKDESDIRNIVLKSKDGVPVYIKNVAEVKIGHQTRTGAVTRDGKGETVAGMVIMLRGENSKVVVDAVKKTIPQIQSSLPKGVAISTFYDRTSLIESCIKTVSDALLQGGIFVIIILFLFLGDFKASLIVTFSIPITVLATFIFMNQLDITANLMSLGGLAIAIGMLVDSSIVITENIKRHITEKRDCDVPIREMACSAAGEVAKPVIFAILIIIIVFFPLFTLEGMGGKMFKPLAMTICLAMISSLVVSMTIVPVLCSFLIKPGNGKGDNFFLSTIKSVYLPLLHQTVRFKRLMAFLALMLFISSLFLIPFIGTEFLPKLDEGAMAINVVRLPSASLNGSVEFGTYIEKRLLEFPEVKTVVTKTGRAEISEDPMGPEQNDIIIMLHPQSEWKSGRTKDELVSEMQKELSAIPGIKASFSQPIALRVNELISGIKSDLAIKIFGPDLEILKEKGNQIVSAIGKIRGAEGARVEQVSGFAQIEIRSDRKTMARYGINQDDINQIVETAIGGKAATIIVEGEMRFDAVVRFPEKYRSDIESIRRIALRAPEGHTVQLHQIAEIVETEAPAQISRENGMRRVAVECNIMSRDAGSFVEEVREKIKPLVSDLPPGYFIQLGGQFENQQRAMSRLSIVVPFSISLIFLMLFIAFGSLRNALLVIANLPFALVGGILVLYVSGTNLSVPAVVGFIALFGIAVGNGILLVSFFNQLREDGMDVVTAVFKGCELRLRPILMTTMTTLLGLIPMLYSHGSGSEIQRPLALVVIGGLVSSLLLSLFILPAIYCMIEKNQIPRRNN
ncbi:MAG TPA: CusA/CzcA family heavy metal efflux RND transporter [Lentisphaeria bacterium]|nr:MAG: metal transporter [Lentisphaerae bacterium GWF2_50_93]HCE45244.1 CusA/CzcA family heavy metal efflux RND transporter [Lentisphaeria bacterium]